MAQKTAGYRSTPTNPNAPQVTPSERPASEDSDLLLDEIDEVLEENELEVVRAFQQRGGQ